MKRLTIFLLICAVIGAVLGMGAGSSICPYMTIYIRTLLDDATQGAAQTTLGLGTGDSPTFAGLTIVNAITEFSTDDTMSGDSDSAVPTEQAVKAYVDVSAGSPGGDDSQVQFNDGGSFAGDATFMFDKDMNILNIYQLTADLVKLEGNLDILLMETGDDLLLEKGGSLLLEAFGYEDSILYVDPSGFVMMDIKFTWDTDTSVFSVNGTTNLGDGGTTNYTQIASNGDQTFAGTAGFYPRRVSQADIPAAGTGDTQIDTGELMMWRDSDDGRIYLVYNDTTSGIKSVELP